MTPGVAKNWLSAHVSRETMERLEVFHELLTRWQKTINIVSPATLDDTWGRHMADSAQLYNLAPTSAKRWLDLGSGGGFPGLVIAAMAKDRRTELEVTLVESDIRKCSFMREASRLMDVQVLILNSRISDIPHQNADVISARALSNLRKLIAYAAPHVRPGTCLLFPKGSSHADELETLPHDWQIRAEGIASLTDPDAVVLRFFTPDPKRE